MSFAPSLISRVKIGSTVLLCYDKTVANQAGRWTGPHEFTIDSIDGPGQTLLLRDKTAPFAKVSIGFSFLNENFDKVKETQP